MRKEYHDFDETTMGDGTYIVGQPVDAHEDPIRIDTGWFEAKAGEKADWEYVVGEIVASDMQEDLELEQGGEGTIDREKAIENILEADLRGNQDVVDRKQATAVVDYFVEEGALTQQNGELVVLQDPTKLTDEDSEFDSDQRKYYILSWTAAIDTCVDYMQETLDTFEEARERLEEGARQVEENEVSETKKELKRVAQDLKNLGPGAEAPEPSDLSSDERERYETLKEDYAYFKAMYEVQEKQLVTAKQGIDQLRRNIKKLKSAKEVYESKVDEMRKAALKEQVFPSDDIDVAKNMAGLITSLTDVENPAKKAKQIGDGEDLNDDLNETMEELGETLEDVSENIDEEETEENLTLE